MGFLEGSFYLVTILIVAGLNICLFVKVWGMTNDIRTMDSNMSDLLAYTKNLQKNVVSICKIAEEFTGIKPANDSPELPPETEPPEDDNGSPL